MTSVLKELQWRLQDPRIDYQTIIVGVSLAVAAFEGYIGSRQKPYLLESEHPSLPASLEPYLPAETRQETYEKSQAYALAKHQYSTVIGKLELVQSFLLLSCILAPVFAWLFPGTGSPPSSVSAPWFGRGHHDWTLLRGAWDLAAKLPGAKGEISTSLVFVAILTVVGTLLSLPQSYYKNFVLEEEHGFNKMTRSTFFSDAAKGFVLSLVLELPLLAGIIWIIHWVGTDGVLRIVAWIMAFIFSIQIVMIPLYPYVIAPLFNKYTPLDETHAVFPKVKALATRLNFPLGRVWVMDGSKRSSHSNAYFFGLPYLTKHIVIYDTLLDKSTPEEVEAILAHELGHWAGKHVLVLLLTSLIQTGFSLLIFSLFLSNPVLLSSFGFTSTTPFSGSPGGPTIIALFLASALFSPLSAVLQFTTNTVTRALEYQADRFAFVLGPEYAKNLKGALVGIHEKNLAVYGVDPVYSAYNNNHPTLIERLDALDNALETGEKRTSTQAKKEL
ncbi:BQ2448_1002 [Microbotryum intermedium]|uniref:CAAX prenyl protease n=1 Tax=Microbotryum intermedium TaxID=269621 RepID=A0A238F9T6_9BASI|nr:BQ2448_1002 [Microbotryum intermedium]